MYSGGVPTDSRIVLRAAVDCAYAWSAVGNWDTLYAQSGKEVWIGEREMEGEVHG